MWWFWIRKKVRQHTKPIPIHIARKWEQRLTFAYFIIAWTFCGYGFYLLKNHKPTSSEERPGIYYAKLLNLKNATIIRVKGTKVVESFEYDGVAAKKEEELARNKQFYGNEQDENREYKKSNEEEEIQERDPELLE